MIEREAGLEHFPGSRSIARSRKARVKHLDDFSKMTTEEILAYMTELIERAVAEARNQRYRIIPSDRTDTYVRFVPAGGYDPDWSAEYHKAAQHVPFNPTASVWTRDTDEDEDTKPIEPRCECCDRLLGHPACACKRCLDCKGGWIDLFTGRVLCDKCDGSGWV